MSESVKTETLVGGVRLFRHYLNTESCSTNCGTSTLWQSIVDEIKLDSIGYYNCLDGTNKFYKHVEIHVYSKSLPYPDAAIGGMVTYDLGNGNAKITCPYSDPAQSWLKSAISHEFGHAWHDWCGFLNQPWLLDIRRWFSQTITIDAVPFNESNPVHPWVQTDGSKQKDYEKFADSWRILFGTPGTRGDLETVTPGFKATTSIPELKKAFLMLPELCAMAMRYQGIKPGTLRWDQGLGFVWQSNSESWIWQQDYNTWYWHNGTSWVQWTPDYVRT